MSSIKDLVLRSTTHSPFTNKNASLTEAELDNNFIIIGDMIYSMNNAISISNWVAQSYDAGLFVRYQSLLWQSKQPVIASDVPGVDPTKWGAATLGDLSHVSGEDVKIKVQGTSDYVSGQQIQNGLTPQLQRIKVQVDLNTTADQLITLTGGSKYVIQNIIITNASINIDTATGSNWYTGAGGTGQWIASYVSSANIRFLSDSTQYISISNGSLKAKLTVMDGSTFNYFLSTAQGVAATADMYIYYYILA